MCVTGWAGWCMAGRRALFTARGQCLWWPGMFGYAAWWLMRSRQVRFELDPVAIAVRAGGLVLLMFGTTMLGALHFYHPDSILPYASGGILGEGLVGTLKPLVSSGGVGLIAAALILIGFPLFSGMSWLQVADEVGRKLCRIGGWFSARRAKGREKRAERAAVRAAAKAASKKVKQRSWAEPSDTSTDAVDEKEETPAVNAAPRASESPAPQERPAVSERSPSSRRERREPSFSAPVEETQEETSTTDTSIPWEAAAVLSERHGAKPQSTSEPRTAAPEATPPAPAKTQEPEAPSEPLMSLSAKEPEPTQQPESAVEKVPAPKPETPAPTETPEPVPT